MFYKKLATVVFILCLVFVSSAKSASLVTKPKDHSLKAIFASQTENLKHSRYICRHGGHQNQRWHCKAKVWLLSEWKETNAKLHPVLDIKAFIRKNHPCLARIIEGGNGVVGENGAYDPTLDFGGGHGNTSEPYGIPQANPGYKMRSAGADWATNPFTQLKWMVNYARVRYGGDCEALTYKINNGSY